MPDCFPYVHLSPCTLKSTWKLWLDLPSPSDLKQGHCYVLFSKLLLTGSFWQPRTEQLSPVCRVNKLCCCVSHDVQCFIHIDLWQLGLTKNVHLLLFKLTFAFVTKSQSKETYQREWGGEREKKREKKWLVLQRCIPSLLDQSPDSKWQFLNCLLRSIRHGS